MTLTLKTNGRANTRLGGTLFCLNAFALLVTFATPASKALAQQPPATAPESVVNTALSGMSTDTTIQLADQAVQNGRLRDAQDLLQTIVEKDRQNLRAIEKLSTVYERLAQQYKANTTDPEAVKLAEDYVQAANNMMLFLAQAHLKKGEERLAEPLLTMILARPPSKADSLGVERFRAWSQRYAQAQLTMAKLLSLTDRAAFAIDRYKDFLKNPFAPQDLLATANIELAVIYRKSSLPAQALDALESARKANPENADVYAETAQVHLARGDYAKARQAASLAVEKSSANPEYHSLLATTLFALKDLAGARESAFQAIKTTRDQLQSNPEDQATWAALSKYYRTYQQVLEAQLKDKNELTTRMTLAQAIQEAAEVEHSASVYRAWEVLNAASEQDKDNPRLLEALATAAREAHKYASAADACNRLLAQDPQNAAAKRILAELPSSQPASRPVAER